ncbi:tripartite tricarboxylate transporter substrate binding protein [Ornithinibacillus californiensis]|uniref:tripartite tricarboxylate transporter substrate binding protein n=1 Tax=Ornithinibacillus californiensis TaxID=161536 RepID=UPI00064DBE03|nr:tripartite tricarboxylate transporter substrate binding protein [Ornithinibacillus californiensis]
MRKYVAFLLIAILISVLAACSSDEANSDASGDWEPDKSIEMVAPAGAGGGWDTTARMAAKVFKEAGIIEEDIGVINKPGGGGAVGWAYIAGHEGSNNHLFVASPPIILVPLNGQSEYSYDDFTPIANVIADYGAFAVRADAPWDDLNDLFEDMKADPESISVVGTSSPGSMDHIQFVQIAKAAGVDVTKIKYVTDPDGVGLTQLLNGSVEVFSTGVAETVEQVKAGTIKVLGITAEERLSGEVLEDFPTAIEQGIDASFVNWRGFFGPPNMDEAAVKYYEAKFKELSDSEEFSAIRDQYGWDEMFMGSEDYKTFLDEQNETVQTLLDELGLGQ